jgi:hypothetical protein
VPAISASNAAHPVVVDRIPRSTPAFVTGSIANPHESTHCDLGAIAPWRLSNCRYSAGLTWTSVPDKLPAGLAGQPRTEASVNPGHVGGSGSPRDGDQVREHLDD